MQVNFKNVTADYLLGPLRTKGVIQSVNLSIKPGTFTAIIGPSGAGKSSLLKAMNGLLPPVKGSIDIGNHVIEENSNQQILNDIRKQVGLVFQFPESQLFAETVEQDICFGPLNFGVPLKEAKEITKYVLKKVGLNDDILTKSPFSLSGGQKRRVAIAGVLATHPQVLILDEPGAGLDPAGKQEILSLLTTLHKQQGLTIILVTHDMNDVAQYAEDVIVMNGGKIIIHDHVRKVFARQQVQNDLAIDLPSPLKFQQKIERSIGKRFSKTCLTIDELADSLIEVGLA